MTLVFKKKKIYIAPIIEKLSLDNIISLQMASQPVNPPPRGSGSKGNNDSQPFASPFGDKPFS
jgi:hypothetical protein